MFPEAPKDLLFVTEEQMREVDRAMIEDFGVSLLQMMENAGRNLAVLARERFLDGDPTGKTVLVFAGPGGNGGGGLSGARHLANTGAKVEIVLAAPRAKFSGAAAAQLNVLERAGHPISEFDGSPLPAADLIIDAIFGYSMRGNPREPSANLIRAANSHGAPMLSNDIPSGIESNSGHVGEPSIQATATSTIALPKTGMRETDARSLVGELYLGDIAVPPELYVTSFPDMPPVRPFSRSHIVRVW